MRRSALLGRTCMGLVLVLATACTDPGTAEEDSGTAGDSGDAGDGDGDGDGDEEGGDEEGGDGDGDGDAWAFDDAFGVANRDDDDSSGTQDWLEFTFGDDNELVTLTLSEDKLTMVPDGGSVRLTLSGDTSEVRVWLGDDHVLGHGDGEPKTEYEIDSFDGDVELLVEFGGHNVGGTLVIEALDPSGESVESTEIVVHSAPVLMNHHLQEAEDLFAVTMGSNASMIADYTAELGDRFHAVPGQNYGFDPWIQDEIEFGTATAPTVENDYVYDSVRNRGLDDVAEDLFEGPDFLRETYGEGGATTYDSFGNLEASPPVTVDGVEYPFGRIYYGEGIKQGQVDFMEAQEVQDPFVLDTSWLCVGHVDEFSTFVPDPSSDKGFKLVVADTKLGLELLDSVDPGLSLPRYQFDHGFATAGEMQSDGPLRAYNEDLQDDHLEPIIEAFKQNLGLEDSDILRLPSIFEIAPFQGCSQAQLALSLVPGMVNLIVDNDADGNTTLYVPDPFFRENINNPAGDPFIEAFDALMPDGTRTVYLDDWDTYHMAAGEVHCGTNVIRSPAGEWWTDARHLWEGN